MRPPPKVGILDFLRAGGAGGAFLALPNPGAGRRLLDFFLGGAFLAILFLFCWAFSFGGCLVSAHQPYLVQGPIDCVRVLGAILFFELAFHIGHRRLLSTLSVFRHNSHAKNVSGLGSVTRVNAALHVFNKDGVLACGKTRDPSRGKQHIGCADSAGHVWQGILQKDIRTELLSKRNQGVMRIGWTATGANRSQVTGSQFLGPAQNCQELL